MVAEHPSGAVEMRDLEVTVFYVDSVRVAAEEFPSDPNRQGNEAPLGIILASQTKSARFLCWSSSRKNSKLTVIPLRIPALPAVSPTSCEDECCETHQGARDEGSLCLPHDGDRDGEVGKRTADGPAASSGGGLRWRARIRRRRLCTGLSRG